MNDMSLFESEAIKVAATDPWLGTVFINDYDEDDPDERQIVYNIKQNARTFEVTWTDSCVKSSVLVYAMDIPSLFRYVELKFRGLNKIMIKEVVTEKILVVLPALWKDVSL